MAVPAPTPLLSFGLICLWLTKVVMGLVVSPSNVRVQFVNSGPVVLHFHWVPRRGPPQLKLAVNPGAAAGQKTQVGHTFKVDAPNTDAKATNVVVEGVGFVSCNCSAPQCAGGKIQCTHDWAADTPSETVTHVTHASPSKTGKSAELVFVNTGVETLHVLWLNEDGDRVLKSVLLGGDDKNHRSKTGQRFEVVVPNRSDLSKAIVTIQEGWGKLLCAATSKGVKCKEQWKDTSKDRYTGGKWDRLVAAAKRNCSKQLVGHPKDVAHFCNPPLNTWTLQQCRFDMTEEEFQRQHLPVLKSNFEQFSRQPAMFHNFTRVGFEEHKIPQDLLQELRKFWQDHRAADSVPEIRPPLDGVLAGCESDTWLQELPKKLKDKVAQKVASLVSVWTGVPVEDLHLSAIYGLRLYRNGSVLYMHTDRKNTHALSAILEVGHLGFKNSDDEWDAPGDTWPLKIRSHNGSEHLIGNKVGKLILYESATCMHGRPTAFTGRELANVFVHFAPRGWPTKYLVPTPSHKL